VDNHWLPVQGIIIKDARSSVASIHSAAEEVNIFAEQHGRRFENARKRLSQLELQRENNKASYCSKSNSNVQE